MDCYAVVVPKIHIERAYPGGWNSAIQTEYGFESSIVTYDNDLFAEGAMSPLQVHRFILRWKELGLIPHRNRKWSEICVVDRFGGPTLPCSWLHWNQFDHRVRFKSIATI